MRKTTHALAILILSPLANPAISQEALETWRCSDFSPFQDEVLVVAIIHEGRSAGSIRVAGTTYTTAFSTQGFDRRWDWKNSGVEYAFVIRPNGGAAYFDFSFADDNGMADPRQLYSCTDREVTTWAERSIERERQAQEAEAERLHAEETGLPNQQAPDLSRLDDDTRMSIQLACISEKTQGPAPYRRCLERQLQSIEVSAN